MKTPLTLLTLVAVTVLVPGCTSTGFRVGSTEARRIAMASDIPGKNSPAKGACDVFAKEVVRRQIAAGNAAHVLTTEFFGYAGQPEAHSIAVFDDNGRQYVMGHRDHAPTWREGTDLQVAKSESWSRPDLIGGGISQPLLGPLRVRE